MKLPIAHWLALTGIGLALLIFGWQLEDINQRIFELVHRTTELERIIINQIQREYPDAVIMRPDSISLDWEKIDAKYDSIIGVE